MAKKFIVKYLGFIVSEKDHIRKETATFINERNCLVSRERAAKIDSGRRKYLVETPISLGQKICDIYKLLYIQEESEIAAYWGIVRVS